MSFSTRNLEAVGATLYVCEGTRMRFLKDGRKHYAVEFTNKDPRIIKFFLNFLRNIIRADESRIKAELFIYPDHDERKIKKYWSNLTKIPWARFNKTILLKQKNFRYKPNPLWTLKIRYTHKDHFLKIQGIIDKIFGEESPSGHGTGLENPDP